MDTCKIRIDKDNTTYICKVLNIHLNNSRLASSNPEKIIDLLSKIVDERKIK